MLQMFILSNLYIANLLLYRYLSVADVLTTRQMLQMFIFILQIFYCNDIFPAVVLTMRQMLQNFILQICSGDETNVVNVYIANLLLY